VQAEGMNYVKIANIAALFMSMAAPALAQSDYYVCQIDHVVHYFNDTVDTERSVAAELDYLHYDFSLPVEVVEAGVAGPEGVFFHDRALENGDHVFTEINADLELMVTVQMVSVSESDWIVARGACQ
jgi:hypothetical protein